MVDALVMVHGYRLLQVGFRLLVQVDLGTGLQ
jgi:hypothetical protein